MRLRPSSLFRDSLVCCEPVSGANTFEGMFGCWRAQSTRSNYLHLEVNKDPVSTEKGQGAWGHRDSAPLGMGVKAV